MALMMDIKAWAQQQFGDCCFGDLRRTKRMVKYAAQAAARPDGATPKQTESWADCKAAYRLFAMQTVTFESVTAPHYASSRAVTPGRWLVLNDTTDVNFGPDRDLQGVGRVGSNKGQGFLLHTAMIVSSDHEEIVGLAAQDLYRRPLKKTERVSSTQRKNRKRETDMWGRVIDHVGRPPQGARFVHVCDRGADNFDVFCHLVSQQADWIIRAAQLTRRVFNEDGESCTLDELLLAAPLLGTYKLKVSANDNQPARSAAMEVRSARLTMPRPKTGVSRYVRDSNVTEVKMWAVETREINPPPGVEALRWVLLVSEEAGAFAAAWGLIEDYEKRPLIEEFHKCLKTGCHVQERLYRTGDRLAPVIGLLSVLAVRLLQLKTAARHEPERPAADIVPAIWITALKLKTKNRRPIVTVRDFIRTLAQLGGFLARKGDGEPGWQTIWSGLEKLLLFVEGLEAAGKKCG